MDVTISYQWVLGLSAAMFAIGMFGFLLRRNAIALFLCLELMLNAANLAFAAFAMKFAGAGQFALALDGQLFIFFVIAVAAAEAAIGLALFIALFRVRETIDVDRVMLLRW